MLVLSRRINETVLFPGIGAAVKVIDVKRGTVRLGIDAPPEVTILRGELHDRAAEWGAAATGNGAPPETLDGRLKDAGILLGLARLQLEVGHTEPAVATLDRLRTDLEALRRRVSGAAAAPAPSRRKALLVEDNDNERELLARFLRQAGIDVDTAGDGTDALDYLRRRGNPDVVLMDMGLPRCDGPTAVREIRRDPRTAGVKVFAVSGHAQGEYNLASGPTGVDGWFQKPIDPDTLVRRLNEEFTGRACLV